MTTQYIPSEMLVMSVSALSPPAPPQSVVVGLRHVLLTHLFFLLPGPPNLGMSRQNLQDPHSLVRHPEHSQLCFLRFRPE